MKWTKRCILFVALACATVSARHECRAGHVSDSDINLGGSFTGSVGLGSGSNLTLGSNAISGNYKQHVVFFNTNIGFSAQNQSASLSSAGAAINTNDATATANLTYDNFTPPTPQTLNSFNANLTGSTVAPLTINSGSISMNTSVGTLALTPTFNGSISGITFSSSGTPADVSSDSGVIDGTFSAVLNGSVTGNLNVLGANLGLGTLYTLPTNTVVTFSAAIPIADLALSDTGVPFGGFPDHHAEEQHAGRFLLGAFHAADSVRVHCGSFHQRELQPQQQLQRW